MTYSKDQLKDVFKRFDIDKDGRLSKEELKKAFSELGSRVPGFRTLAALQHADENGDGFISGEELDSLLQYALQLDYKIKKGFIICNKNVDKFCTRTTSRTVEHLRNFFKRCVSDADERLSKKDIANAFKTLGLSPPSKKTFAAISSVDENGNRYVGEDGIEELVEYVMRHGYTAKF